VNSTTRAVVTFASCSRPSPRSHTLSQRSPPCRRALFSLWRVHCVWCSSASDPAGLSPGSGGFSTVLPFARESETQRIHGPGATTGGGACTDVAIDALALYLRHVHATIYRQLRAEEIERARAANTTCRIMQLTSPVEITCPAGTSRSNDSSACVCNAGCVQRGPMRSSLAPLSLLSRTCVSRTSVSCAPLSCTYVTSLTRWRWGPLLSCAVRN
jgi:hypothetical protein